MGKSLGEVLQMGRQGQQLTLRQVEESTGISNAYLSQLENGKIKKPSANVLYKLATLYGMQLEELLIASGIVTQPTTIPEWVKSLGPMKINNEEEIKLLEYLSWLRYKRPKNKIS